MGSKTLPTWGLQVPSRHTLGMPGRWEGWCATRSLPHPCSQLSAHQGPKALPLSGVCSLQTPTSPCSTHGPFAAGQTCPALTALPGGTSPPWPLGRPLLPRASSPLPASCRHPGQGCPAREDRPVLAPALGSSHLPRGRDTSSRCRLLPLHWVAPGPSRPGLLHLTLSQAPQEARGAHQSCKGLS